MARSRSRGDGETGESRSEASDGAPAAEPSPETQPEEREETEVLGEPPPEGPSRAFPLVAIGASAGGLAALEAFFSSYSQTRATGFSFVVLQHLSPKHRSAMRELIQRHTNLEVSYVTDGTRVEPEHVYIVPAGSDAQILNGTLHLLDPVPNGTVHLPIDFFFRSLAHDLRDRAICVVLSGSGSDGTAGLRAVKAEGGLVVVQEPKTTEYDGMPRSAIATGLVDLVLPPGEIPPKLIAYVRHTLHPSPEAVTPAKRSPEFLKKVCVILRTHTGHDFSQYKSTTLSRRVERRMAIHQLERPEDYFQYLRRNPIEAEALFRDLLIGVTSFFRDPPAFDVLIEHVIPRLFEGRPPSSLVRVWVPGCSSGEEAYSIAILIREHLDQMKQDFKVQIFGSDVDRHAIERARAGVYPESIATDVTAERLQRFFSYDGPGGTYRVMKTIRDMLVFAEQDVIRDPPFSRLDLLSCRNLLIYLNADLQRRLLPLFHYALNPGGFLFLGTSESVGDLNSLFDVIDRKAKIFRRRRDGAARIVTPMSDFSMPARSLERQPTWGPRRVPEEGRDALRELTERTLLRHLAQPAVLVNSRGDVLHIHGRTGKFLEPAPGESGMNILAMAREGLRRDLTMALHRAVAESKVVNVPSLRVRTNGDSITARLTLMPVISEEEAQHPNPDLFLVLLEELGPAGDDAEGAPGEATSESGGSLAELARELRAKDEYVQTILEEMETTNEELKSSNEEMQSVNEELQSTNEELETSKEELQSVNEELATINAELQTKVVELSQANNDMNNLLAGTGVATLFLDLELRIARFTPATTELINVIQTDVGRPVGHVVTNLVGYDRLIDDLQTVLETLAPREIEVQTKTGAWFLMRLRPYRTLQNVIEGLVVTFVDISERRRAEEMVREQLVEITSYYENAPVAFAVLDRHLRFVRVNRTFADMNGLPIAAHLGKAPAEVMPTLGGSEARRLVEEVVSSGRPLTRLEVHAEPAQPPAVRRTWVQGWFPLHNAHGEVAGYSVIAQEVTEREHLAELVRVSEANLELQMLAFQRLLDLGSSPETREVRDLLQRVLDIAIDVSGAEMGDIRLVEDGKQRVVASRGFDQAWIEFVQGNGDSEPAGVALKQRERVVVEDVTKSSLFPDGSPLETQLKAGVRGVQSTPIVGRDGRALGTFSTHFRTPRRPDDRALRLLDLLARQTADLVERSRRSGEGNPR